MLIEEWDGQRGALAGPQVEQEFFLTSQEKGANHHRVEVLRDLGIRLLELEVLGLVVIEPHPALLRRVEIQTAELLESAHQIFVVENLVRRAAGIDLPVD